MPERERRHLQHAIVLIDAGRLFTASATKVIDQALYALAAALGDGAMDFGTQDRDRYALQEAFDALYALAGMLETISDAAPPMNRETRLQAVA